MVFLQNLQEINTKVKNLQVLFNIERAVTETKTLSGILPKRGFRISLD